MILNKVYHTSARWDKTLKQWDIAERLRYQWNDMKKQPVSPEYEKIESALEWIKEYDVNKSVNNHL
jgi:hypothetical protein